MMTQKLKLAALFNKTLIKQKNQKIKKLSLVQVWLNQK